MPVYLGKNGREENKPTISRHPLRKVDYILAHV